MWTKLLSDVAWSAFGLLFPGAQASRHITTIASLKSSNLTLSQELEECRARHADTLDYVEQLESELDGQKVTRHPDRARGGGAPKSPLRTASPILSKRTIHVLHSLMTTVSCFQ